MNKKSYAKIIQLFCLKRFEEKEKHWNNLYIWPTKWSLLMSFQKTNIKILDSLVCRIKITAFILFLMMTKIYLQYFRPISLFFEDLAVYYCYWSKKGSFRLPNVFLANSLPFHVWRIPWLSLSGTFRLPQPLWCYQSKENFDIWCRHYAAMR